MYSRAPSFASPLPSLLRATLAFTFSPRLASFSHSLAHLYEHKHMQACTATGNTHTQQRARQRLWHSTLLRLDGDIYGVTSGVICWSLQQLSKAVDPPEDKVTYRAVSGCFSVDAPSGNQHLTECQGHVRKSESERHWNTTLTCFTCELALLSFCIIALTNPGCIKGFFYHSMSF